MQRSLQRLLCYTSLLPDNHNLLPSQHDLSCHHQYYKQLMPKRKQVKSLSSRSFTARKLPKLSDNITSVHYSTERTQKMSNHKVQVLECPVKSLR